MNTIACSVNRTKTSDPGYSNKESYNENQQLVHIRACLALAVDNLHLCNSAGVEMMIGRLLFDVVLLVCIAFVSFTFGYWWHTAYMATYQVYPGMVYRTDHCYRLPDPR